MSTDSTTLIAWTRGRENNFPCLCAGNIVFHCGNFLKFIESDTRSKISQLETRDTLLISGHPSKPFFAVYNGGPQEGTVTIYKYPSFHVQYTFTDSDKIIHLQFISSSVILTLSKKSLKLWDFKSNKFIVEEKVDYFENFNVVSNPNDGKKFILQLDSEVFVYVISVCGDFCELSKNLITTSSTFHQGVTSTFLQNRLISFFENPANDSLPQFCLLNLPQENFEKYLKNKSHSSFLGLDSFCWLDVNNVLVSSDQGHFFKYNVESASIINELDLKQDSIEESRDQLSHSIISLGSDGGDIYCLTENLIFMHLKEQNCELQIKYSRKVEMLSGNFNLDKVYIIPDRRNGRILLFFDKSFVFSFDLKTELMAIINNDDCAAVEDFSTFYQNGDYLATIQNGGRLSFWKIENDSLAARKCLPFEITAVAALSSVPVIFLGDNCGYLYIYDMTAFEDLRLILRIKIYNSPLDLISTDQSVISAASTLDGRVYFIGADPLQGFEIFEWTDFESGKVDSVSLMTAPRGSTCLISVRRDSFSEITIIEIENFTIEHKTKYSMKEVLFNVVLINQDLFLSTLISNSLVKWTRNNSNFEQSEEWIEDVRQISVSRDGKNLSLLKNDGSLAISTPKLESPHNLCTLPRFQGNVKIEFSFSGRHIIASTWDGSIYCFVNRTKNYDVVFLNKVKSESWQRSKVVKEMPLFEDKEDLLTGRQMDFEYPMGLTDLTWHETFEIKQNIKENLKYSDQKKGLRTKLKEIADSIRQIRIENELKPEIEKLEQHQLVVDIEREENVYLKCDNLIDQIKSDTERENSSKETEIEDIKKQYWTNYDVKGHCILAFKGTLEVSNFPMLRESDELAENVEKIKKRENVAAIEKRLAQALHEEPTRDSSMDENMENSLHTQFYPQSIEYRFDQIGISHNKIREIKKSFNNLFNENLQLKRQALIQVNQKTQNKFKIFKELTGRDKAEPVYKLCPVENPVEIFEVTNDEISNELKIFIPSSTECDKGKMDDDNWRERGLKLMMDGVLEVKKEFFKKEPEMPDFMVEKEQTKWTVEEIQMAEEYNRKIAQSREEFEQYKKILENEIKKMDSLIEQVMDGFDEKLQNLFKERIDAQLSIIQEELTIARMKRLIIIEQEFDFWEVEMLKKLEKNQNLADHKNGIKDRFRKITDGLHEEYEVLVATDKMLEKSFRVKFDSVSLEKLVKIFKRRPKFKHVETREELSTSHDQLKLLLADLDSQHPDDMDPQIWDKFCAFRRQKLESEFKLKKKYILLSEALAFQTRTAKDIDDLQKIVIPDIRRTLTTIAEKRNNLYYNLEIQFAVKQGQVEIHAENGIRDYSDAVLLHRSIVENLNADIKKVANLKVNIMKEGKDVMNSIAQLEWDHKKMQMQYEDIIHRMREIKNFKVSRDMHKVITNSFVNVNSQDEISALEQAIVKQSQHGEKVMDEKRKYMAHIKREKKQVARNNNDQLDKAFEVDIEVNERRLNYGMTAHENENSERDDRYSDIVCRRRMIDTINTNANQITSLKGEVERLRMAMYPSLY